MPLESKLLGGDLKLEACAVKDTAHIVQGAHGDHVRKIQSALNLVDRAALQVDGIYGAGTAAAVLRYKQARDIVNRKYQQQADNIVGRMTIERLDKDVKALEAPSNKKSAYICVDFYGCTKHDHSACPRGGLGKKGLHGEIEVAPDGSMNHFGTPRNPLGFGKMITIGGAWEAAYLGFENYVPDPLQDPGMIGNTYGRPFTNRLRNQSVSDISFRSTPLDHFMHWEIPRICMVGARLTYVSEKKAVDALMRYFAAIGSIIETGTITKTEQSKDGSWIHRTDRYAVVTVLNVNPWLKPNFLSAAGPRPT